MRILIVLDMFKIFIFIFGLRGSDNSRVGVKKQSKKSRKNFNTKLSLLSVGRGWAVFSSDLPGS